jgi:hypothetical protein
VRAAANSAIETIEKTFRPMIAAKAARALRAGEGKPRAPSSPNAPALFIARRR